jgi:adenylate kinase
MDRNISEMFTVGGTGILIHKYLGTNEQNLTKTTNAAQAAVLKEILKRINAPLDCVLELQIDEEEIVTRLASRNRDDDNADVVRHRLKVYRDQTAPIIDFYKNENLLTAINASGSIADITERAIAALSAKK